MPTAVVTIHVNSELYLRDPETTELGKNIVRGSIELIDELGFEAFTFKKLAEKINSTEASIYRYFQSKNQLLNYLVSWYWRWVEYLIDIRTLNIDDPAKKLTIVIEVLADAGSYDPTFSHVDEALLHRIVMAESARVSMTKQIETGKQSALFEGYQSLMEKISSILKEINPRYKYPKALVSTIITLVQEQLFYATNYPEMTELKIKRGKTTDISNFCKETVLKLLT